MTAPTSAGLFKTARDAVFSELRQLAPPVASLWSAAEEQWLQRIPAGLEAMFLGPFGTPAFSMLEWGLALGHRSLELTVSPLEGERRNGGGR